MDLSKTNKMGQIITERINNNELKHFAEEVINEFGSIGKSFEGMKVIDAVDELLLKKKILVPGTYQAFVEVLHCACALYNVMYDGKTAATLFALRDYVYGNKDKFTNMEEIEAVLQTIEAQDGESSLVPLCKPTPNSPTEVFSMAVWMSKRYEKREESWK